MDPRLQDELLGAVDASPPAVTSPRGPNNETRESPLNYRHQQILRYAFEGMKATEIASLMNMHAVSIRLIIKSPIFQGELARLRHEAELTQTNMPVRLAIVRELNGAGIEATRLNRRIMNDDNAPLKVRVKIASHFMDRVVFDEPADGGQSRSYRDILNRLDEVSQQIRRSSITPAPTIEGEVVKPTTANGHHVTSDEEVA